MFVWKPNLIEKKIYDLPFRPYTITKHVPVTIEKKVPYEVKVPIPQPYIVEKVISLAVWKFYICNNFFIFFSINFYRKCRTL